MLTRVRPPETAGACAAGAGAAAAGAAASAPAERGGGAADWQATAASKTIVRTNAATLRAGIGRLSFQVVRLAWQRRPLRSTPVARILRASLKNPNTACGSATHTLY